MAVIAAQSLGYHIHDKLPLWISTRYKKGRWTPELRLWCLWLPLGIVTIGLGIIAAAFKHHYHYMALAVGFFLVYLGALLIQPIAINYAVENFPEYSVECTIAIAINRLGWGVAIPFYISKWERRVHLTWVFGMAAFFTLGMGFLLALLISKGRRLRQFALLKAESEDGIKVK